MQAGQDSDAGGGGWFRDNVYVASGKVYAACSGCVGDLSLGDMDSCRDVPQYKVVKYLVFGIISSSLLLDCGQIPVYVQSYARAHAHAYPHTPTRIRMRTHTCSSFKQTEHCRRGLSLQTSPSVERPEMRTIPESPMCTLY